MILYTLSAFNNLKKFLKGISKIRPTHLILLNQLLLLIFLPCQQVLSQTKTANEYVKPYTENFMYGNNMGYYGGAWKDEQLAELINKAGGRTLRPTLPDHFIEKYGINVRLNTFNYYTGTLGMKEIVCFVEGPSDAHRDKTIYAGNTVSSKLFANLYQPVWNVDGTVNQNNYYAYYIYRLVQAYGNHIRFWEVVNEPDYVSGANPANWLTRAPLPSETKNTLAPFYHYIRMLRITWEVVKKYNPDDYVTPGGIGYPEYLDALLRYTDNPADGSVTAQYPNKGGAYFDVVSYHVYPAYFLRIWDNTIKGFKFLHTSDYAAGQVITHKDKMEAVLQKYGYNGTTYPRKHLIVTETNISRRTSDWRYSSDEMHRNFGIKVMVLAQKNSIKQLHMYSLGESANAPDPTISVSDPYKLMGLYENLARDTPGYEKLTQQGKGFRTVTQFLSGARYDGARTGAMNLPAGVEGGAFVKDGKYTYVLWAKAQTDKSEYASATYSFPASLNIVSVNRHEWDYPFTSKIVQQTAQNIALNGSPVFFTANIQAAASVTCSATGSILWEQWAGISGSTVATIPQTTTPSITGQLTQFEAKTNIGDNYGARVRGYVCAPVSGNYTFYIAGDDNAELWLSTDANTASKRKIAYVSGWTSSRQWTKYTSQKSASIYLTAGQKYYIEALQKEAAGGDNLAVAWVVPTTTAITIIPGANLSPFVLTSTAKLDKESQVLKETEFSVYPNPAATQATVQFTLAETSGATLTLYDLQGRLVRQLFTGRVKAGELQTITLNENELIQQVYLVRLVANKEVFTHKLIIVK
jgi:hypothetical protein